MSKEDKYRYLDEAQRQCKAEACAIQSCLRWRANYDQKKCKKEIDAYNKCVKLAREALEAQRKEGTQGEGQCEAGQEN